MMTSVLIAVAALVGLVFASDIAVKGARSLARRLGVSPLLIGLTVTSIGTSLPEIATNIAAGLSGDGSGLAVGNVIGSNLSQITLLLGITGSIATLTMPADALRRDGTMLVIAVGLMWLVCIDGDATPAEGLALIAVYIGYLGRLAWLEKKRIARQPRLEPRHGWLGSLLRVLVGLGAVVFCAHWMVEHAVAVAREIGVSDAAIGLLVGVGTGIPELTVSLRAIAEREGTLSLGNLLGSNITDPLLSFGAGAAVGGVAIESAVLRVDFPFWLASTLVALLLLRNHLDLNRRESSVLILIFALYVYVRFALVVA